MTNNNNKSGNNAWMAYFSGLAILFAIAAGYSIYIFFLGNPANFEDGDVVKGHPLGLLGIIYRGGIAIVPLLIAVNITVILVTIERFITLSAASGKGNATEFVHKMRGMLASNNLDGAIAACDQQRGSLANVVRSGLTRYQMVATKTDLNRDEKKAAIEKELEEATGLELPMLSKNLVIISTCDNSDFPNLRPHITTLNRDGLSSITCWLMCGSDNSIFIKKEGMPSMMKSY